MIMPMNEYSLLNISMKHKRVIIIAIKCTSFLSVLNVALYFLIKMNLWQADCVNVGLPCNSPAMQREEESCKHDSQKKYFLLGPCYHLVNNVEGGAGRKVKADMGETDVTEEIVRDIKLEKVRWMEAWHECYTSVQELLLENKTLRSTIKRREKELNR